MPRSQITLQKHPSSSIHHFQSLSVGELLMDRHSASTFLTMQLGPISSMNSSLVLRESLWCCQQLAFIQ